MIPFACPKCDERPVELICIGGPDYDESKEFHFNTGRDRMDRGEFRCVPCAIASRSVCYRIDDIAFFPGLRRTYEFLAERVQLRRWR
jgi:hypothetical protein